MFQLRQLCSTNVIEGGEYSHWHWLLAPLRWMDTPDSGSHIRTISSVKGFNAGISTDELGQLIGNNSKKGLSFHALQSQKTISSCSMARAVLESSEAWTWTSSPAMSTWCQSRTWSTLEPSTTTQNWDTSTLPTPLVSLLGGKKLMEEAERQFSKTVGLKS